MRDDAGNVFSKQSGPGRKTKMTAAPCHCELYFGKPAADNKVTFPIEGDDSEGEKSICETAFVRY